MTSLVDTHCHLDMLEDLDGVLARMRAAGVQRCVTIGVDVASSQWAVALAARRPEVLATVGLHPHDAKDGAPEVLARLESLAAAERVVGVGEAGLDYYYDNSPRDEQRRVFAAQIGIAHRTGRTLVIHSRDAFQDTFSILEQEVPPSRVVFHCWSGGPDEAMRAVALGAVLSFSGTVTFRNAEGLRESARVVPDDRIVVETDAPFLTPVPHRGKRNEPAYVPHTLECLARERGLEIEEAARLTTENARRLFELEI